MILCDPFAVNTMLWSVLKIIHDATTKETLPRVSVFKVLFFYFSNFYTTWHIYVSHKKYLSI